MVLWGLDSRDFLPISFVIFVVLFSILFRFRRLFTEMRCIITSQRVGHVVDEFSFFLIAFWGLLVDMRAKGAEDCLIIGYGTDLERSALTRYLRVVLPKFF